MNTEIIEGFEYFCPVCAKIMPGTLHPGTGPHWGKWYCGNGCKFGNNEHLWAKKPDSDPSKYRRENTHKDLVVKYGSGYCEMCLRAEVEIKSRSGETLEAHHKLPYQYNGNSDRENIWILCTACHKYVEHVRRYYNNPVSVKILVESIILSVKKSA